MYPGKNTTALNKCYEIILNIFFEYTNKKLWWKLKSNFNEIRMLVGAISECLMSESLSCSQVLKGVVFRAQIAF